MARLATLSAPLHQYYRGATMALTRRHWAAQTTTNSPQCTDAWICRRIMEKQRIATRSSALRLSMPFGSKTWGCADKKLRLSPKLHRDFASFCANLRPVPPHPTDSLHDKRAPPTCSDVGWIPLRGEGLLPGNGVYASQLHNAIFAIVLCSCCVGGASHPRPTARSLSRPRRTIA